MEEDKSELSIIEDAVNSRACFTSEQFKIEVNGLPKFFGIGQAKKLFNKKLKLNTHKIKYAGKHATYMFVNFKNEEDREKAIQVLNGYTLKDCSFKAFKANPPKDPMIKRIQMKENIEDERSAYLKIKDAVCSLHSLNYEDQLKLKEKVVEGIVNKIFKSLKKENPQIQKYLAVNKIQELRQILPIVPSPIVHGYRNKCEFTIGLHPDTKEISVGFRLGSYRNGSVSVVGVQDIPIISDLMVNVCQSFESFVKTSGYEPYNNISQSGYWKQLTLRTSKLEDLLVLVIIYSQNLSNEDKIKIRHSLNMHFKESNFNVTSLNVSFETRSTKEESLNEIECLSGPSFITEQLFDYQFSVSPNSFFQVNTSAAEVLYNKVGDLADLNSMTNLIDVCCGTGTIGLCLAHRCRKVIGIELIEDAIKNAIDNAKRNNISNAEFLAGKAEYLLHKAFKNLEGDENIKTVAIVDPPRAGLHPKAIHGLRNSSIKTLVYISCDAQAAMQNFINLGKPPSKVYFGDPFIPKTIIPVDLFPHTPHFELIILFERITL